MNDNLVFRLPDIDLVICTMIKWIYGYKVVHRAVNNFDEISLDNRHLWSIAQIKLDAYF